MRKSHEAREKLLRLGIFRQVDVLIDTCQGRHPGCSFSLISPRICSPRITDAIYVSRQRARAFSRNSLGLQVRLREVR